MHKRRQLLAALALAPFTARAQPLARTPLRVGLTKVFLDDQMAFLRAWRGYVEARLNRPVDLGLFIIVAYLWYMRNRH